MDGVLCQPSEAKTEIVTPIKDTWEGGGGRADLRTVLLGGGTEKSPFRVGSMGDDLPYGE